MNNIHHTRIDNISECLNILQEFSDCLASLQNSSESGLQAFAKKFIEYGNFVITTNNHNEKMGFIAYYANDNVNKKAFISMIAVHPQYREKHVGSSLIDYCFSDCICKGMTSISLEVAKNNLTALYFYTKKGFIKTAEKTITTFFLKKKFL